MAGRSPAAIHGFANFIAAGAFQPGRGGSGSARRQVDGGAEAAFGPDKAAAPDLQAN